MEHRSLGNVNDKGDEVYRKGRTCLGSGDSPERSDYVQLE